MKNITLIALLLFSWYVVFTSGRAYQTDYIRSNPTQTATIICKGE